LPNCCGRAGEARKSIELRRRQVADSALAETESVEAFAS
jgi:hypothetical protein